MKKFLSVAAAAVICSFTALNAFAAGFATESETVFAAQTPYDKKYVSIDWNTPEGETVGVPLSYGGFTLVPSLNKVNKLSEKDGKAAASAVLGEKVSENSRGVVLNDTLFQPTRTSINVIGLGDMNVVRSERFGEIVTDVAADGDSVYFGYKSEEKYRLCCATHDLETIWEYESSSAVTSPAKIGDKIIFGSGDKLIVRAGNEFTENPVGAEITHIFAGNYAVFMSCKDGRLAKLRLDADGKTEEDSLMFCEIGGELTQPAGIENHIYVGSTEGFFVVDGLNMEITESFDELKGASAPVVTTGGGVRAYTAAPHSDPNGDRWYLYSVLDTDEALTCSELAKIIDFTNGRTAVSKSGRMFFRDAAGRVWAISATKPNVLVNIVKAVLILAIIVMILLILRAWAKKRQEKRPPEY